MWFSIDFHSHIPVYEQIKSKIKHKIMIDEIQEGEFIPSIRNLAKTLGVNLNTVARAYRELEQDGIIKSIRGKGYIVVGIQKDDFLNKHLEEFKKQIILLKDFNLDKNILFNIIDDIFGGE
ncbi:MAG: GntR family transcriptional regulator [Marinitoga sp. 4572_148]|nr:MAG: GntR family transcriptional regulator [Marinitoga sp. 4572_148]